MFDSNPNDFFWATHKAWHQKESTNKVKINKYKSTTLSFVHQLQKLHKGI